MTRISALFFAFFLLFTTAAGAGDAARSVMIGQQEVFLPQIAGFQEIYGVNEAFDTHVRQFVPAENRLLGVYVSDADAEAIKKAADSPLGRYMLVQTPKGAIELKSEADFNAIRDEIIKGTGENLKDNPDIQKQLNDVSGYLADHYHQRAKLQVGETRSLGAFMNYNNAFGVAMLANVGVQGEGGDVPIATSVSVMNVKGAALFFNAYTNYAGDEDADFVRNTSKDFAKAVFAANGEGEPQEAATPVPAEAAPKPAAGAPPSADPQVISAPEADTFINTAIGITGFICLAILGFFIWPLLKKLAGKKDESI